MRDPSGNRRNRVGPDPQEAHGHHADPWCTGRSQPARVNQRESTCWEHQPSTGQKNPGISG